MTVHLFKHLTKKQKLTLVDRLMYTASVINPLTALPQVYDIYSKQDATSVSLMTWLGFMAFGLVFLSYGIAHRIKPFIVTQLLWFAVDLAVVAGVLIYG